MEQEFRVDYDISATETSTSTVKTFDGEGLSINEAVQSINKMQSLLNRPLINSDDIISIKKISGYIR